MWRKNSLQKYFILFAIVVLVIQLIQLFYFQQEAYLKPYDMAYWQDRVEHSRYFLPLSSRGLGDDSFYAYAGYKILEGVDPTHLVFDKPALGIAILGLVNSIYNPAFTGLVFGFGSLLLTFAIVYKLTKKVVVGFITTLFLLLDPLFFESMFTSLLDLPQLFFLLANIFFLQLSKDHPKYQLLAVFASGLILGIFAQLKIPVILPFVFAIEIWWIFKYVKRSLSLVFIIGILSSLIFGYLPYMIHGYSFIDFVKIQKYVFAFYRDSKVELHAEAIWQYLLFGNFPSIAGRTLSRVAEWSLVSPIATIIGITVASLTLFRKSSYFSKFFAVILLISLLIFTFIPSYPRYLLIILPFLYFFMVQGLFSFNKASAMGAISVLFVYSLFNTFMYFHPSPASFLSYFYSNITKHYFQDIYQEQLSKQSKKDFTISEFNRIGHTTLSDAKISNIEIMEGTYSSSPFSSRVLVPVTITYKTEYLGNFSEKKEIELIKESSEWKVNWKWDYLLNEFNADRHVESKRIVGRRGSIITNTGTVLAQDTNGYLISFNPKLMEPNQEKKMLSLLNKLSSIDPAELQNKYLENPPPNQYIPLFTTQTGLGEKEKEELLTYKGIKVQEYPIRIFSGISPSTIKNTNFKECCTRIYSSYNYHGTEGLESMHDKELSGYDGGTLQIIDSKGTIVRTVIKKDKKDGQNVILTD